MTEKRLERIYATARVILPLVLQQRAGGMAMSDLDETDFMSAASVAVSAAQALEDEIVGEEG